jgi:hypothetical protein
VAALASGVVGQAMSRPRASTARAIRSRRSVAVSVISNLQFDRIKGVD